MALPTELRKIAGEMHERRQQRYDRLVCAALMGLAAGRAKAVYVNDAGPQMEAERIAKEACVIADAALRQIRAKDSEL